MIFIFAEDILYDSLSHMQNDMASFEYLLIWHI